MAAGSKHVVRVAAAVLLVALAAPTAAFANGGAKCKASACQVYYDSGAPSAGEQQPPAQTTTGSSKSSGAQQSHTPKRLSRVLLHAGKDRAPLQNLLNGDAAIGNLRSSGGGGSPSLLGAAFDLGAGPTVLLAILLATALGLAARGSLRGRRGKRSRS